MEVVVVSLVPNRLGQEVLGLPTFASTGYYIYCNNYMKLPAGLLKLYSVETRSWFTLFVHCVCVCVLTVLNPDGFVFPRCVLILAGVATPRGMQWPQRFSSKPSQPAVIANYRASKHNNVQASPGAWLHMQLPLRAGAPAM